MWSIVGDGSGKPIWPRAVQSPGEVKSPSRAQGSSAAGSSLGISPMSRASAGAMLSQSSLR
jgi:hypothetical protein